MPAPPSTASPKVTGLVAYAWVQEQLRLPPLLLTPPARASNVPTLQQLPEGVTLVPARMVPAPTLLEHLLFALKHEGVNLLLLARGLPQIAAEELQQVFARTPNGVFIRKACYLWERFTGAELVQPPGVSITAGYAPMFEPDRYAVGASRRNPKWRIDFNGLGDLGLCPVVRLTDGLKTLIAADVLGQAREFAGRAQASMLERALSWAYLSETEGSFAIEDEVPTASKAAAFSNLLKHTDEPKALSEAYLVELQNSCLTHRLDLAVQYRHEQNRLQGPGRGAIGVSYVPPEPELCHELMQHLLALANSPARACDPLVHAAVVSFSFVFIHPFMDGNGRLSRFLLHHCLGQSGRLPQGFLLPISVAMKRNEAQYLDALRSFSRPARELCQVTWLNGADFSYEWAPEAAAAFRYMDLTRCVEFTLQMAREALTHDLLHEAQFLADFDAVQHHIDDRFDLRSSDLATLILSAFDQGGSLSRHRRQQFAARVPPEALAAIEAEVKQCLEARRPASATGQDN